MRRLLLTASVLLLLAGCASAPPAHESPELNALFLQGKEAYQLRDYARAQEYLLPAAQKEHRDAQFYMAVLNDFGQGMKVNHEQAVMWYQKAAAQGQVEAQYNLAISYEQGMGVGKDDAQAVYWFTKAAEGGDAQAQLALGIYYRDGRLVEENQQRAVYWLQQAADQGNEKAIKLLLDLSQ